MTAVLNGQSYWGAALGLLVLLGVFVAVLMWMFRPGAGPEYQHGARLPLDDGTRGNSTAPKP
jgi:cbb3-type cytochrome oxidase subunit 3